MRNRALTLVISAFLFATTAHVSADEGRAVYETTVDAPVADVWKAFTTDKGLQSWMAPRADIDLAVGGKMRANYNPQGRLGDENKIVNSILAFDPERMLSLKAVGFPKGFPFEEAARKTWSVFYFEKVDADTTKITVVGLGYTDAPESVKLRQFFAVANEASIGKLKDALSRSDAR